MLENRRSFLKGICASAGALGLSASPCEAMGNAGIALPVKITAIDSFDINFQRGRVTGCSGRPIAI